MAYKSMLRVLTPFFQACVQNSYKFERISAYWSVDVNKKVDGIQSRIFGPQDINKNTEKINETRIFNH
jgi:hypothetical protein